jgi:hypothetical protein
LKKRAYAHLSRFCSLPCKYVGSKLSLGDRLWRKVITGDGCWEWQGSTYKGYGRLTKDGTAASGYVWAHRLSWELAYGPIPAGLGVLHRCDNRRRVRPDHLFLGTHGDNNRDNNRDAHAKGRGHVLPPMRGAGNPQAKLTDDHVREIRARSAAATTRSARYGLRRDLCAQYGIAKSTLASLLSGKNWSHVK